MERAAAAATIARPSATMAGSPECGARLAPLGVPGTAVPPSFIPVVTHSGGISAKV
jgi:hypothetical protein